MIEYLKDFLGQSGISHNSAGDDHDVDDIWAFPKIVGFPPKSFILIGFSIINHPFWGTPILETSIYLMWMMTK